VTAPGEADQSTEFFTAEQETPDGWRLPLLGNLISFRYFRPLDLAFEVWLGGDDDVTVRLERPFTYGRGDNPETFDPRTTKKSDLAPLLGFGDATVKELLVTNAGELSIAFSASSRLVAPSADDGGAWSLDLPVSVTVRAIPRPGERAEILKLPTDFGDRQPSGETPAYDPKPNEGVISLPIRGGDAEDQTTLGPMLDLVGKDVVDAQVEADGRLRLSFGDGSRLTAVDDRWEAHWPDASVPYNERWVPPGGPNIP